MLTPVLVTPPATLAVTLAEVKDHLRIEHDDHDGKLTALIRAAVDHLDGWRGTLGRALITQGWRVDMACFVDPIRLPLLPIDTASIAVSYLPSTGGAAVALDPAAIEIAEDALGVLITRASGASWPSPATRLDAVRVAFDAGYGPSSGDVPPAIRTALTFQVALGYEPHTPAEAEQKQRAIERLLANFRIRGL